MTALVGFIKRMLRIALVISFSASTTVAREKFEFANLAEQLDQISQQHGIDIRGLEPAVAMPARRPVSGDIERQLEVLLSGFNYAASWAKDGKIEDVIILGLKTAAPKKTVMTTRRVGKNHIILAAIRGINNSRIEIELVVDTGASYIVLPESMIDSLGLDGDSMDERMMQSVNGRVNAKLGRLSALEFGNEIIRNVEVAFIEDELLGGVKLLGMNVLNRYRITLDDQKQTITFIRAE